MGEENKLLKGHLLNYKHHLFTLIIYALLYVQCVSSKILASNRVFTFIKPKSYLSIENEYHSGEDLYISFHFRTDRESGLLLQEWNPQYNLLITLDDGQIKISSHLPLAGNDNKDFLIGTGLNNDVWHQIKLKIHPSSDQILIKLDDNDFSLVPISVKTLWNKVDEQVSHISFFTFGGLKPNTSTLDYNSFVGCIGHIAVGQTDDQLLPINITESFGLKEGCKDACQYPGQCLNGGLCTNHYTYISCNCLGTGYEGKFCSKPGTTVTLRGFSYFTYKQYGWSYRLYTESNTLTIRFKTAIADSALFYGIGSDPELNFIAVSLVEGKLLFEIDFGTGKLNATLGYMLDDENWHSFKVVHSGIKVNLYLDKLHTVTLEALENSHALYLDPEVYIGASPEKLKDIFPHKNFAGCIKDVYFNNKNILLSYSKQDNSIKHHGILPVEYGCSRVKVLPVTFSQPQSKVTLEHEDKLSFEFSFEFKTAQGDCTLASGKIENTVDYWEIRLLKHTLAFIIVHFNSSTGEEEEWLLTEGTQLSANEWHYIGIVCNSSDIKLSVDYHHMAYGNYLHPLEFSNQFILATSTFQPDKGLVGCIRDINIDKEWLDPRSAVGTSKSFGLVSLDNCKLINPCDNPNTCEHGSNCSWEDGEISCNCEGTGYVGKTCHFATYRQSCQELYVLGFHESGVYKIDIDGNGPLPPSNVYCSMNDPITKRVENNIREETVIRKYEMDSYYLDILYRDFNAKMLQYVAHHSNHCSQYFKYDCFKTPLGLRTYTWMKASSGDYITSIESKKSGFCRCADKGNCVNSSVNCNCDIADARWRVDEGTYTDPNKLGITRIYILKPHGMEKDAEARLFLGPLECEESDSQRYIITLKSVASYIKVPGWQYGNMAFGFRTASSRAQLIYQASLHESHKYFQILLLNAYELSFEIRFNKGVKKAKLTSKKTLNSGEWQNVWIDFDAYYIRFTLNLDSVFIDFDEGEKIEDFEGPLYIGGAPKNLPNSKEGFIGCFRGLVIDNDVINLHKNSENWGKDIVLGCESSCSSNPCQNNGNCIELWGTYKCECSNPVAHSGQHCEHNVNTKGMTFLVSESYYHQMIQGSNRSPALYEDILLNFRTFSKHALLFYAFDHFNNFVQLHFSQGRKVFFTFNSQRKLYQVTVDVPGLSRGLPIQVKVQRRADKTILIVNGQKSSINQILDFLTTYYQDPWLTDASLETVFPPRGTFRMIDHSEIFLGYVGSGTVTNLPSFVGCFQGLKIGENIFDLESAAVKNSGVYGEIRGGCKMACDLNPCRNGGTCVEHWKNHSTACDCTMTAFVGDKCDRDIGGYFDGKSIIRYTLGNVEDTSSVSAKLTFSIAGNDAHRKILLLANLPKSSTYILVAITQERSLLVEENRGHVGVVRKVINGDFNFTNGQHHWVYYSRSGEIATVVVNGKEFFPVIGPAEIVAAHLALTSNFLVVGGNSIGDPRFQDYSRFEGCISNVIVQFGKQVIMPLESALGYHKGTLSNVNVDGFFNEKKCTQISNLVTHSASDPVVLLEIAGGVWNPEPVARVPFSLNNESDLSHFSNSSRVAIGMAIFLALVFFAIFIYMLIVNKYQKKMKVQKRFEDDVFLIPDKKKNFPIKAVSFSPVPTESDVVVQVEEREEANEVSDEEDVEESKSDIDCEGMEKN